MNLYNLTEKFLLLFPFYRERVRVMDSYALRLSEAVEALHAEAECHAATRAKLRRARGELEALMQIAVPVVKEAGKAHGEAHVEAFHGIPQPDMVARLLYPRAPHVHYAFVKAFNQSLKPRQNW